MPVVARARSWRPSPGRWSRTMQRHRYSTRRQAQRSCSSRLIALGVVIALLVFGGIFEQSAEIKSRRVEPGRRTRSQGWLNDAGVGRHVVNRPSRRRRAGDRADGQDAAPGGGERDLGPHVGGLLPVVPGLLDVLPAEGRAGVFRSVRSTRYLGIPLLWSRTIVTGNGSSRSLQRYFLGVTIVAGFNAVVVGHGRVDPGGPAGRDDRGRLRS